MSAWELDIPAPDGTCRSVNWDHQRHHYEVAAHRKQVRADAKLLAEAARVPALGRVKLTVDVYVAKPRAADPWNYAAGSTVKAAIDGLVDAGVVPDDTWEFVTMAQPRMRLKGKAPGRVVLTITPWVEEEVA